MNCCAENKGAYHCERENTGHFPYVQMTGYYTHMHVDMCRMCNHPPPPPPPSRKSHNLCRVSLELRGWMQCGLNALGWGESRRCAA